MFALKNPLGTLRASDSVSSRVLLTIRQNASRKLSGFTLAELIVVVSILAVLATIWFLAISGYTEDAKDSKIIANIRSVSTAISSEAALTGNSPRYYVVHNSGAALSGAFAYIDGKQVVLTGGNWNEADTNYSAGNPDYVKLKLDPEKFRVTFGGPSFISRAFAAYGSGLYDQAYLSVGAMDAPSSSSNGHNRVTSYFQVAGVSPVTGKIFIAGDYPGTTSVSGSTVGLIDDPSSESATGSLVDSATSEFIVAETISQTGSCIGLPAHAVWNTGTVITQTQTGNGWAPSLTGSFNPIASATSCVFKCSTGYAWNATTSACDPLSYYTQITNGNNHSCVLTEAGGVKCWGYNAYGQLGDGTTTDQSTPVDVVGLTSGVIKIVAGYLGTCALTSAGGVRCWGYNAYGQLGDGTTVNKTSPVDVLGLSSGVTDITGGMYTACALTSAGGVKCWGYNTYGGLGDGTTNNSSVPVDVVGLSSGVARISAGQYYACAIVSDGAKCWGWNTYGQLGDGTTTNRTTPVDVVGLSSGVTEISAKTHSSCALTSVGGVKCWGANWNGQLGDGTTTNRTTPVDVVGLSSGVTQVESGYVSACAIQSGAAKCWGYNAYGQLGDGTMTNRTTPVDVSGLSSGVTQISATGQYYTCAIQSGAAKCWGWNAFTQLGIGGVSTRTVPVTVSGLSSEVSQIIAGSYQACAITSAGGVKCWGNNAYGQLGDGTVIDKTAPVAVSGLSSGVSQISTGNSSACAITSAGGVKCWGNNTYGQLGDGTMTHRNSPVAVSGLSSGVSQVASNYSSCALTSAGGVKCWGVNWHGQLGDGTTTNRTTPVDVSGLSSGVTQISAGLYHICALTSAGGVKCWGYNVWGQLGDGTTTNRTTPVDVSGLSSGVTQISAGHYNTCATLSSGGVKCWGPNWFGQLGNGAANGGSYTPVNVSDITSGVTQISVGAHNACAVVSGSAKCWGYNVHGQIGDGTLTNRYVPTDVTGLSSGVTQISTGFYSACATVSGSAKCWGWNSNGQVGDGENFSYPTPQNVGQ